MVPHSGQVESTDQKWALLHIRFQLFVVVVRHSNTNLIMHFWRNENVWDKNRLFKIRMLSRDRMPLFQNKIRLISKNASWAYCRTRISKYIHSKGTKSFSGYPISHWSALQFLQQSAIKIQFTDKKLLKTWKMQLMKQKQWQQLANKSIDQSHKPIFISQGTTVNLDELMGRISRFCRA